jgi:hypothetical protein
MMMIREEIKVSSDIIEVDMCVDNADTTRDISNMDETIQVEKENHRRKPILAWSVGLAICALISVLVLLISKGPKSAITPLTLITNELVTCRKYPKPPPFAGKKGVAISLNDNAVGGSMKNVTILQRLQPYWNYGWALPRSTLQPDNIEYVPMVWGGSSSDMVRERIATYVTPHIQSGQVKRIFGYNEPDAEEQSNILVQRALDMWPALESTGVSIVSPSCALPGNEWMRSFMNNVTTTCKRVDWVAVHWYGSANFTAFKKAITKYYYMYGRKPIIITEFAIADFEATKMEENFNSREKVLSFMKQAVPWLEGRSWIVGYAWFSFGIWDPKGWTSAMYNNAGDLSILGKYYASVRNETPQGNRSISYYK